MILQPVSDQTLCGGLSLGSQPLLYQLPGAALRGGWTLAMVLVLTHPPLYYPGSPPGVTATASPSGAPRGWPWALVSCFGRGPGSKSHQPPRGRKAATRELSLEPLLCWSHSWAPCSPVGKREHHRGGVNCGAGATRAVAEVGQRLGARPTAFPRNRPQEPPPHRGQASLSAAQASGCWRASTLWEKLLRLHLTGVLRPNCFRTAQTWSRWWAAASPTVSAMPCGAGAGVTDVGWGLVRGHRAPASH